MADQQQIDLLLNNAMSWNIWRLQQPVVRPDLSRANLMNADLSNTDLSGVNLRNANLMNTDLFGTDLSNAILDKAIIGWTCFGSVDLRTVRGLDTVQHIGPSEISTHALVRSH